MIHMNSISRALSAVLAMTALAACSVGAPQREPLAVYDLGPPGTAKPAAAVVPVTLLVSPVHAPASLDTTAIVYRLAHLDPARPDIYAQSRWAMSPALMTAERLRARLAPAFRGLVTTQDGARADFLLRVELQDFSQVFDTPQSSRGVVRLRATLVNATTRALAAQRDFGAERPAGADAPGAARALAEATDAALSDLAAWAVPLLRDVKP